MSASLTRERGIWNTRERPSGEWGKWPWSLRRIDFHNQDYRFGDFDGRRLKGATGRGGMAVIQEKGMGAEG